MTFEPRLWFSYLIWISKLRTLFKYIYIYIYIYIPVFNIYIYIYIYTRFQKHCNLKNIYTYIHLLSSQRENERINMKTIGIYMYIYFSSSNVYENGCIYIYIYVFSDLRLVMTKCTKWIRNQSGKNSKFHLDRLFWENRNMSAHEHSVCWFHSFHTPRAHFTLIDLNSVRILYSVRSPPVHLF